MFQGIVIGLGKVESIEDRKGLRRLGIDLSGLMKPGRGDSVSVNGTCLTVTESSGSVAFFDVIAETLDKTNLGSLKEGDRVNLEAPMRLDAGISGHMVQGHVECISRVTRRVEDGGDVRISFETPKDLSDYIIPKGSIALDGVSMTIAGMGKGEFSVAVIPETLERTTLGFRKEGDVVNIETDFLLRGAMRFMEERLKGLESRIEKLEGKS